jgi:2-polyprenyl-3-methyl-5-hydroxy-6-metoxy-1,4-benzoquinol methylase
MKNKNIKVVESEWDEYWYRSLRKNKINKFYDRCAYFYRNFLIGPSFKYYINKYFSKNADLLHAGCGGGEIDNFVIKNFNITAVDISSNALKLYEKLNPKIVTKKMDIFDMNLSHKKFDGIYNLGVVEHFNEEQFIELMKHFKTHLKSNGKIVLFWPPKYGFSVIVLHIIHFIINKILKFNIKLHPDEPFKYHSRSKLENIIKPIGLKVNKTHFNYMDAFTYSIIIIELS